MSNEKLAHEIAEEYVIRDLDTLKVIADPLRVQIIHAIGHVTPRTVKQVSKALGLSPNKLYYHINMLEEHGLIQVVETRVVSGIIEKLYLTSARSYNPAPELLTVDSDTDSGGLVMTLDGVWSSSRQDLLQSVRAGVADPTKIDDDDSNMGAMSANLMLSPEKAVEFNQRLQALVTEYAPDVPESEPDEARSYRFFYIFFPLVRVDDSE